MPNFLENVFRRASLCRHFENKVYEMLEKKLITCPTYLSKGQEFISATIATLCEERGVKPLIFAQHRAHSTYLSFGGDPYKLARELLGKSNGCANGKGGSASIHSPEIGMFGHSGYMGDNVPIGIGACFASKLPTICFFGDGSAEQDYVLGSIGWASTKNLPILFVCEDNDLSILTKKEVRRTWNFSDVGKAFGLVSFECLDAPATIVGCLDEIFQKPLLLNIQTTRLCWHAGSGMDDPNAYDQYQKVLESSPETFKKIDEEMKEQVEKVWEKAIKNG